MEEKFKTSKQLRKYYNDKAKAAATAIKVEIPSANKETRNMLLFFTSQKYLSDPSQYQLAKKIFEELLNNMPSGIFKHLTKQIIEYDKKFNKYGDQS